MNWFDLIYILNEKDIDKKFLKKHEHLFVKGCRGFGYWLWKPYLIKKILYSMNNGDQLLYVDAGCHLNYQGQSKLNDYFNQIANSELKVGGFQLENCHNEKRWTKMDLIKELSADNNDAILNSGQICATHVLIQKCDESIAFINEWLRLAEKTHLIDDTPSIAPNYTEFQEHRHDQSIFSLLCKLKGAITFSGHEVYPSATQTWDDLKNCPIHDRRDKQTSLISRLISKVKKYVAN